MKIRIRYSPEVSERAVRLVLERQVEHDSQCPPPFLNAVQS